MGPSLTEVGTESSTALVPALILLSDGSFMVSETSASLSSREICSRRLGRPGSSVRPVSTALLDYGSSEKSRVFTNFVASSVSVKPSSEFLVVVLPEHHMSDWHASSSYALSPLAI